MKYSLMYVLSILAILAFSNAAMASAKKQSLEAQVANSLNWLFEDTINEGDGRAEVNLINGKPAVKCSTPRQSANGKVIFCSAEILIVPDTEREYSAIVECTGLSFRLQSSTKVGARYSEEASQNCLEDVSGVTEF